MLECPRVEFSGLDHGGGLVMPPAELGALVDPDRLRVAKFRADPFQRSDDILGPIAEAGIDSLSTAVGFQAIVAE